MSNKKFDFEKNKIVKFANKMSLIDAVDNLTTIHSTKGTYNKKVLINVNNFGDKSHEEKQASFYWSMEDALIIADDVINNRFENEVYLGQNPGFYSAFGGGQVSRILTIGYKDGRYTVQVALFKAKPGANGSVMPDKANPIDSHSIQIPKFELRKFMIAVKNHIQAATVTMLSDGTIKQPTYTEKVSEDVEVESQTAPEETNNYNTGVQDIDDFLSNL